MKKQCFYLVLILIILFVLPISLFSKPTPKINLDKESTDIKNRQAQVIFLRIKLEDLLEDKIQNKVDSILGANRAFVLVSAPLIDNNGSIEEKIISPEINEIYSFLEPHLAELSVTIIADDSLSIEAFRKIENLLINLDVPYTHSDLERKPWPRSSSEANSSNRYLVSFLCIIITLLLVIIFLQRKKILNR